MNGILFFIAGAFFGALVVCFSVCTAIFASVLIKEKRPAAAEKSSAASTQEEEVGEDEKMKIQFANFLNYDGTTNGQSAIGDE